MPSTPIATSPVPSTPTVAIPMSPTPTAAIPVRRTAANQVGTGPPLGHNKIDYIRTYFFAGDATYEQVDLVAERVDGVTYDPAVSLATIRAIKTFAREEPTIILPAHDPDGPRRLAAGVVFA